MRGAVVYARYSSERQNDQSIEGQLDICQRYAAENGLTIIDTYIDRAMTGTNDQRPAFQQMLADCAKPVPWDIVLVYAIDKIVLYDDKIEIYYNYTDPIKPGGSSSEDSHRLFFIIDGSNLLHPAAPQIRPALP